MERRTFVGSGLVFIAGWGLVACQHEYREEPFERRRGWGPPPHAPAHGYRHHYRRGVDLVFDSGLGVYLVADARRTYYFDGRFYRFRRGGWFASRAHDGPWRPDDGRRLPRPLRRHARRWRDRDDDRRGDRRLPPRSPAHGYRYRYRGADLVFDSGLGVYLVIGAPRTIFFGNRFYRYQRGEWYRSDDGRRTWAGSSGRRLPARLRERAEDWDRDDRRRGDRRGRRRRGEDRQ
ncbi:MAG: hypothetical protein R3229_03045 [Alphaproteobacteria bacterium]|nr:hypothetical protein [Alphaproteobacteria bacterium]